MVYGMRFSERWHRMMQSMMHVHHFYVHMHLRIHEQMHMHMNVQMYVRMCMYLPTTYVQMCHETIPNSANRIRYTRLLSAHADLLNVR